MNQETYDNYEPPVQPSPESWVIPRNIAVQRATEEHATHLTRAEKANLLKEATRGPDHLIEAVEAILRATLQGERCRDLRGEQ